MEARDVLWRCALKTMPWADDKSVIMLQPRNPSAWLLVLHKWSRNVENVNRSGVHTVLPSMETPQTQRLQLGFSLCWHSQDQRQNKVVGVVSGTGADVQQILSWIKLQLAKAGCDVNKHAGCKVSISQPLLH